MDHNHKVSGKPERVTMETLGDLTWYDSGILDSFPLPFPGLNKYQRSDFTNCRSLSKIKF